MVRGLGLAVKIWGVGGRVGGEEDELLGFAPGSSSPEPCGVVGSRASKATWVLMTQVNGSPFRIEGNADGTIRCDAAAEGDALGALAGQDRSRLGVFIDAVNAYVAATGEAATKAQVKHTWSQFRLRSQWPTVSSRKDPVLTGLFAFHPDFRVRRLLEDHRVPTPIVGLLARDSDEQVAAAALQNPDCPPEVLRASAVEGRLTWATVRNPSCPPDALEVMSRSESPTVRSRVAAHPSCPPAVLVVLAQDVPMVRMAVNANPNFRPNSLQTP